MVTLYPTFDFELPNSCCVVLIAMTVNCPRPSQVKDPKNTLTSAVTEESGDVLPQNKSKTCRLHAGRHE